MKKLVFVLAVAAMFLMSMTSCERIDAGHEGIRVNLYGDKKGVDDVQLVTGWVFYNPFTTRVYEYPTYVQTVDFEAFTINAKDGSEFMIDPTVSLKVVDTKSPQIFKKYRKNLDEIIETTMYNYVKNAFRIVLNNYTTDEIVSKRDTVEQAIEKYLSADLNKENFQLEQLTSGLKYPDIIVKAVNSKNETIQRAQQAQNEVKVAQAQAEKLIIAAEAERKANELKTQTLTPAVLEKMWIEKWNGEVPQVITNGNTSTFLDINKLKK